MLGFPPPLHSGCSIFISTTERQRVCLPEVTSQAGCSTSMQPGKLLWRASCLPFSLCCSGGTFGSPTGLLMAANGVAGFSVGTSTGVSTSVGSSVGAANSAGSLMGVATSVVSSVGADWVSAGMVAWVQNSRDLLQGVAHSRMAFLEKAT